MIPIEELRTLVGLGAADATDDALLTALELAAVDAVALQTRTYLGESSEALDRVIGDGTSYLSLPRWPITAVDTVEESYPLDVSPSPIPVVDFIVRDDYQLWRTGSGVWADGYEYAVTYTAGYTEGAFPPIYVQAVKDIVSARYPVAKAAGTPATTTSGVKQRERFGPYEVEFFDAGEATTDADTAENNVAAILTRVSRYGRIRV